MSHNRNFHAFLNLRERFGWIHSIIERYQHQKKNPESAAPSLWAATPLVSDLFPIGNRQPVSDVLYRVNIFSLGFIINLDTGADENIFVRNIILINKLIITRDRY